MVSGVSTVLVQIVRLDLCLVPECIELLLEEVGNFEGSLSNDSMVCAACYIFCQRTA